MNNPSQGYFITGTDTGIGKTFFAIQLLKQLRAQGYTTAALKPIATGCQPTQEGLRNEDALLLQNAATLEFPYDQVNPFIYPEPIAPHIAAQNSNQTLSVAKLLQASAPVLNCTADYIVVEGAGGWLVPLNQTETLADFAKALNFSVLLVVGMRLGCLNHALLTWQNMHASKIKVAGWIANSLGKPMDYFEDNVAFLTKKFNSAPLQII